MTFKLEIDLDNKTMERRSTVAGILRDNARRLDSQMYFLKDDSGIICDVHGNQVGTWRVTGQ
jgi:hypothetical protein